MKVLIVNNSGNVGKSFLSRELFYANFTSKDKAIIEIENGNSSSVKFKNINVKKLDGKDLSAVFDEMMNYDDYVVDVGSRRIEQFFLEIEKADGGFDEDDIDLVVVPCTSDDKIHDDTKDTLTLLEMLNLKHKTKIVFNRVENMNSVQVIIDHAKKLGFSIDENLRILNYEAINGISSLKLISADLVKSKKDYKQLAREAAKNKEMDLKKKYIDLYTYQKYAIGIKKNLDTVYALLLATK